jgi:beta-phosphoglucomutase
MLRAAIFDFDGVLADSEPLHYRSLRECLEPEGIAVTEADYASFYLAYTDHDALRLALERAGLPSGPERIQALARRKETIFQRLLPEVQLYPGARALVTTLAARFPVGIASGALRGEIEGILDAHALREPFSVIVGADEVVEAKPSPAPYLAAVDRLRTVLPELRPEECLAVEDSMAGIEAARAAGMVVFGVTHSYPADRLGAAHHVVASLDEIEPALARLCPSPATAGAL